MKRLARVVSLERRAGLLAAMLPARYWFRAAVLMSRWHALLTNIFGKSRRGISEAYLREHWLVELSRRGPFPVPLRVTGAELLAPSAFDRGGVVLCATHVPLLMVMLRAAILSGHKPELVLAHPDNMTWGDNAVQPTGLSEGVPAVPPGPSGLLKIRTILRKKGLVSCTLDRHAGGPNHPDVLVLAGRLGARIVVFRADLAPDGVVNVSFRHPMHPYCESYKAIEANMMEIREDERQLLASLDHLEDSNASIAVLTQPDAFAGVSRKFGEDELTKVAPLLKKYQSRD